MKTAHSVTPPWSNTRKSGDSCNPIFAPARAEREYDLRGEKSSGANKEKIRSALLAWYRIDGRHDLPWRESREPYNVLVSELMLQQTQVPRVIPKYNAFIKRFPTIGALAKAERSEVLLYWQGLGYNNRAVRLHALAKIVTKEHGGRLPDSYDALRELPGIGPYTAGAIMAFAYDKPAPCVDVNIRRVLARLFWTRRERPSDDDIDALASELNTASKRPHDWNSALMDFGSAICVARDPGCDTCPLRAACKSKGARPDETNASKRQSSFHGSTRWWRGQILKQVLENGAASPSTILSRIDRRPAGQRPTPEEQAIFRQALVAMEREGLIALDRPRGKEKDARVRIR